MTDDDFKLIHGSGNVYRDFGLPDADVRQLKALLAVQIMKRLDRARLTVRAAQEATGVPAADFSRIRHTDLARFTVDRLITILNKMGAEVTVNLTVRKRRARKTGSAK